MGVDRVVGPGTQMLLDNLYPRFVYDDGDGYLYLLCSRGIPFALRSIVGYCRSGYAVVYGFVRTFQTGIVG